MTSTQEYTFSERLPEDISRPSPRSAEQRQHVRSSYAALLHEQSTSVHLFFVIFLIQVACPLVLRSVNENRGFSTNNTNPSQMQS